MVFEKQVHQSDAFREFWMNVEDSSSLTEVIAMYETELTAILTENGFTYDTDTRFHTQIHMLF
jgi:rhamnosyltransferase